MIIPSIDLMDGKVVQLRQGKEKVLERDNVFELAEEFSRYGEVAVIDLDAAMGRGTNLELVKEICKMAKCRVGGGIRTVEIGNELLRAGAEKLIIGTKATPEFLKNFPNERVIVAVDSKGGKVVTEGWQKSTTKDTLTTIKELEQYCCGFLYTLVDSEGLLQGIDIEKIRKVREVTQNKITAAGGISTIEEIRELENIGVDSQIGMAIYKGNVKLCDAFTAILNFEKNNGLIPTIVQDNKGQVLMMAYSTKESLKEALKTGKGCYYSRTRSEIWEKGSTSGNTQKLLRVNYDCDRDTLLFTVKQKNVACHLGEYSCFREKEFYLEDLYDVLKDRVKNPKEGSLTSALVKNPEKIKRKINEEAFEVVTAKTKDEIIWEIADLAYFTLVLMAKEGIGVNDIKNELRRRRK